MLSRKRLVILLMALLSMRASAQTTAPALTPAQQWWELQRQPPGPQTVVRVHDPCAIFANNAYYLFCTGRGTPMFRSDDLYHWTRLGVVFPEHPAWAAAEVPGSREIGRASCREGGEVGVSGRSCIKTARSPEERAAW